MQLRSRHGDAVTRAVGGFTFALIEASEKSGFSPVVAIGVVVGAVATVAFIAVERSTASPMLPLEIDRKGFLHAKGNFDDEIGPTWWGTHIWRSSP